MAKKIKGKVTYRKFLINAPPLIKAPRPFDKKNNLLISAELVSKSIISFKSFRIHFIL
jgi:hypothetical protein